MNESKPSKKKEIRRIVLCLVFLAVGILAAFYISKAEYYKDHFLPGTTINGKDVGDKTAAEIEPALEKEAEDYSLTLIFRNGEKETLQNVDFDYQYEPDDSVQTLLDAQNPWLWFAGDPDPEKTVDLNKSYSEELLEKNLFALPEFRKENNRRPSSARIAWNDKDTCFYIIPEDEGTTLIKEPVLEAAKKAVESGTSELDVSALSGAYREPQTRANDASIKKELQQLNDMAGFRIVYDIPGEEDLVLDGSELRGWLEKDEDGNYIRGDKWNDRAARFVNQMANRVDTIGQDHTFVTQDGKEVVLSNTEDYGWQINRKAEISRLKADLKKGISKEHRPFYFSEEAGEPDEHNGFGNTFAEVDLTNQKMRFWKDGRVVLESDVVSGTMDGAHNTPQGLFYLLAKQQNAVLRGADYVQPVNYWMQFTYDGIGFHDATWRGSFGGDIYQWGGSHGCVNMPLDAAGQLYDLIDFSTPIITYYLD
ncbi:MAG: L,D-transpeptidase family protein [Eubacterium sp.]|nr:L,D-transpeptidase family protein [Eubacterium sp.]